MVVGFSKWDFASGEPSEELMEGPVTIISGEKCKAIVSQIAKPKYVICATGNTCAGDTGGPLFLKKPYHVEQVGVTSYSYGKFSVVTEVIGFSGLSGIVLLLQEAVRKE